MVKLKSKLEELIKEVSAQIALDYNALNKNTNLLLAAYNSYQEDERQGVDYIFCLSNQTDLEVCVKGGLTASQISAMYEDYLTKANGTLFFYFGENHKDPQPLTMNELRTQLLSSLPEVVKCILAYPYVESYRALYTEYITNQLIGE